MRAAEADTTHWRQFAVVPMAFYEIVGEADLIGDHDAISPQADPLAVFSLEALPRECGDEIAEEGRISTAPDHYHKANISGGAPYEIALPDPRADPNSSTSPIISSS